MGYGKGSPCSRQTRMPAMGMLQRETNVLALADCRYRPRWQSAEILGPTRKQRVDIGIAAVMLQPVEKGEDIGIEANEAMRRR